jgi:AcrR family transcriptional regulator
MRKGEETRQTIVAKAAPLFNQQGYAGASMADIMAATGLQKGGLYNHFASKEELAAAAFAHNWQQMRTLLAQALAKAGDSPVAQLHAVVRMHGNLAQGGLPVGGCPLLNTAIDSDDGNALLREQVRAALGEWQQIIQQIVAAGRQQGELRHDVVAEEVATTIIGALEGALMLSMLFKDPTYHQRMVAHLDGYVQTLIERNV